MSGPVQKLLWGGGMSSPVQSSPVQSSPVHQVGFRHVSARELRIKHVRGSARVGADTRWAAVIACAWCGAGERWADDDDESQ